MSDDDTLFLAHEQLDEIPEVPLDKTRLIIYRNNITVITPLPSHLLYIDISDNQIRTIENLENLSEVRILDLGYNLIEEIEGLNGLCALEELYLNCNNIKKIEKIDINVVKLDLSSNDISELENLNHLSKLEELYIANNNILIVSGLVGCDNLKVLGLQNNKMISIDCLNLPQSIEILLLYECCDLEEIYNISHLINLTSIDIEKTKIINLEVGEGVEVFYN